MKLTKPPWPTCDAHHSEAGGAAGPANGDVTDIRAATMLPAQLLQPGEIIILLLKPSPWFILLSSLKTLVVILLATMALVLLNSYVPLGVNQREFILLGVTLSAMRLAWQFVEWLSRVYVLTDQRIIRVKGVIRVTVFEAQLKQIQQTELVFTLRERLFGLGTLSFATAGTALTEAYWMMIEKPLDVQQKVRQAINRYTR